MNRNYKDVEEIPEVLNKADPYLLVDADIGINGIFTVVEETLVEEQQTEYAGLGKRMAAYLIDLFIVIAIVVLSDLILLIISPVYRDAFWHKLMAGLIIWTIYYGLFESSILQATPGKMLYKLKVISKQGQRIGFIRSSLRFLASFLSILPAGFGIWDLEFAPCFQAWHDRLLGCCVVSSVPVTAKIIDRLRA